MISKLMHQFKSPQLRLLLVLLLALILRTINLGELAYMHDELSVLSRVNYSSFSELIEQGVIPDFHPPLVQVAMFYWVKIVGWNEWIVKLPFIIMGILSVYFTYWIGRKWFSENTGIAAAVFMACSEQALQYTQIIRPYGSGVFLGLLLVISFIKGFEEENTSIKFKLLFSVLLALCGYNHHFSLVFAGVFGILALLLIRKKDFLSYVLFCVLGALLYLPNVSIFLKQMSYGGIGEWLGKPSNNFIYVYFNYLSHYNAVLLSLLALCLLASFVYFFSVNGSFKRHLFICIALFFIPFLLAFIYSLKVNPVIQFSTLYFSAPFLILGLFSFLTFIKIKPIFINIGLIAIVVVMLSTLVYSRNYYGIMAHQPMERYTQLSYEALKKYPTKKVLINTENWFIDFYQQKNKTPFKFESFHQKGYTENDFINWLNTGNETYFIGANLPENWTILAKYYFPYVFKKEFGFTYEWFLFSKKPLKSEFEPIFSEAANKENKWEIKGMAAENGSQEITAALESDLVKTFNISEIIKNRNYYLALTAEIKLKEKIEDALLVESIEPVYGGEAYDWRAASFKEQINCNDTLHWQPIGMMNRVNIIYSSDNLLRNSRLKTFIWNNKKGHFLVRNFKLSIYEGNKEVFKLYYE
jgi:uncharacterized membrane protein